MIVTITIPDDMATWYTGMAKTQRTTLEAYLESVLRGIYVRHVGPMIAKPNSCTVDLTPKPEDM